MKHFLQWVATHLDKPGYFCSLQIVAGLVGVNAAGAVLTHFQTISHMAADPISHRIGSQILHSIPVLASLSGALDVNALTTPLAGAVVGALLTMIGSGLYSGADLPQPSPYDEAWAQPTESAEPRRTSLHTEDPRWMNSVSSARQV